MISGPDFLKSDDIWSDFIKLDQLGGKTYFEKIVKMDLWFTRYWWRRLGTFDGLGVPTLRREVEREKRTHRIDRKTTQMLKKCDFWTRFFEK